MTIREPWNYRGYRITPSRKGWDIGNSAGKVFESRQTKIECRDRINVLMGRQHPPTKRNLRVRREARTRVDI